jgi:hypothetical protein
MMATPARAWAGELSMLVCKDLRLLSYTLTPSKKAFATGHQLVELGHIYAEQRIQGES